MVLISLFTLALSLSFCKSVYKTKKIHLANMPREYECYTLIELRAEVQRKFAKVSWRKKELVARTVCITMGDNRCRCDFLHSS